MLQQQQRAASIAASQRSGGGPASPASVSLTMVPASIDTRERAYREGNGGSNYGVAFARISPLRYLWWSHAGAGANPSLTVAALSGLTGIQVSLGAGSHTAAAVATATRSAATSAGLTASGTGAVVTLSGLDVAGGAITTGTPATSRGLRRWWGHRHSTGDFGTDPLRQAVAARVVSPASSNLLDAIGVHLVGATSDNIRLAVYSGGATNDLTGTTLIAEGNVTADGTGWYWVELPAAQCRIVTASTSLWIVAKSDTGTSGALRSTIQGVSGSDMDAAGAIYVFQPGGGGAQIDPDPTVAYPASLAPITVDATFSVTLLVGVRLRSATEGTDASLLTQIGTHGDHVFDGPQSDLLVPDAGGANPSIHTVAPALLGMQLHDVSVAYGTNNTTPHRLGIYTGGTFTARTDATVLWDAGQTASGITEAWATIAAPTGGASISVPASVVLWPTVRNRGGATLRFAEFAAPEAGGPRWDPPDYVIGTGPDTGGEYESVAANTAHATDPATPFESPSIFAASDIRPGNGPGVRYRLRIPGIG